jgi:alkylated DNA repair protein alkB family protein 7
MHVTSWPSDSSVGGQPPLSSIVARLKELFLSNLILASPLSVFSKSQNIDIQMHLLHLRGAILPHIDNLDASGSMIMGVSLGSPRVMRMVRRDTRQSDSLRAFEILLLPGSVYIQRYVKSLSSCLRLEN